MKLGAALRASHVEAKVRAFLNTHGGCANVLNLGAGLDSLYWRLSVDSGRGPTSPHRPTKRASLMADVAWLEVDSTTVVEKKAATIRASPFLQSQCGELGAPAAPPFFLQSPQYSLAAADLCDLDDMAMILRHVERDRPTLIIMECVMVYICFWPPKQLASRPHPARALLRIARHSW